MLKLWRFLSVFTLVTIFATSLFAIRAALSPTEISAAEDYAGEDVSPIKEEMLTDKVNAKAIAGTYGQQWCRTQQAYDERYPDEQRSPQACPVLGPCDNPATRDANIPKGTDVPLTIRLKFNIFRNSDGSSPAASGADVAAQVATLNQDFLPSRIQFIYDWEYIDNSTYRNFADSEESGMKNAYADNPSQQLNVYVVNIQGPYIGVGTFPWDGVALGNLGGTIIDDNWFGDDEHTTTHEIGHCLGLWHTHHGVSEVSTCGACWERADGVDGDVTGDLCSDTRPTPVNYNCGGPGGTDPCSGVGWNPTDVQNYMGYAPDACYEEFSLHQWGRMHCWIMNTLSGWLGAQAEFAADVTLGQGGPLNVQFTDMSDENTDSWTWDFGDGDSSFVESPSHLFQPGLYDVSLRTTTPYADAYEFKADFVCVAADTMWMDDLELVANVSSVWEIYGTNMVDISEFVLPVQMTNVPSVVFLDSVNTDGCRTDYFEWQDLVFDNRFNGQLAIRLRANNGGGSLPLEPGFGPILRVYLRTRINATPGQTSDISLVPMDNFFYQAKCPNHVFEPVHYGATLTIVEAPFIIGDANDDEVINILDITAVIDYVFRSGPAPNPEARGDVTCDGVVNILDVTFLIDYVFRSGDAPPQACP